MIIEMRHKSLAMLHPEGSKFFSGKIGAGKNIML